jgi:hypothetical protein
MQPRVISQLGVESAGQYPLLADRHRVSFVGSEHLYIGTVSLDPGRPDEDCPKRLVTNPFYCQIRLKAL